MELYKIIKKRMPEDEYKSFQMRNPTSELIQMELSHVESDEFGIRKESLYPIIGTINDQVFHDDLFSEVSGNLTDFIRYLVRSYYEPNCGLPFHGNAPIFDMIKSKNVFQRFIQTRISMILTYLMKQGLMNIGHSS